MGTSESACGVRGRRREALGGRPSPVSPRPDGCHLPPLNLNFFLKIFFFFFVVPPLPRLPHLTFERASALCSTVFRRHYASVGRLGPFPATPRRITENRRPPRWCDHRERRRPVGARPFVRWRCPRRCVLTPTSPPHRFYSLSLRESNRIPPLRPAPPPFPPPPLSPLFYSVPFFLLLIQKKLLVVWFCCAKVGLAD